MPLMVLSTSVLTINANALAQWCSKMEVTAEVEEKDVTVFTSLGWKEVLGGLKSGSLGLGLKNDFAASALDSIMWPLFGTVVPWTGKATSAAVSVTNPLYSGGCLIKNWTPITGSPGDVNEASYTYPTSGAIVRAIT
jgi:hypothetical protein